MSVCLSKANRYNGSRRLGLGFKDTFSKEQESSTMKHSKYHQNLIVAFYCAHVKSDISSQCLPK